ncbi:MAG: hypothetical protein GWN18_16195, partial [Thermoplasmata archaeon]|nr:hypothetical protein [Thermoplasmata archaeon]NIS13615.1 hypothetical protein [Thermoplasmata archaeon]NIS21484.1 hypothetical protein [Thermoplasmata archaeon]NIT79048.1 hypothetical protein [Thermoplasmata archaeon]NIU50533.1 hypothetical protein [Thermoplasmata archaeon]
SWQHGGTPDSFTSIAELMFYDGYIYAVDPYRGVTKWSTNGAYQNWKI